MSPLARACRAGLVLLAVLTGWNANADVRVALREGETFELDDFYFVSRDCKSLLADVPAVEIMEGPPGVTVSLRDAMVTPFAMSCANPVRGAKVTIAAADIMKRSESDLVLRFRYKTRSGERQVSRRYRLALFPSGGDVETVAVKSGETIELGSIYWVARCRSTMIGLPALDIVEGAPELTFAIKEAQVVPSKYGCTQAVEGGRLVLTAGTIAQSREAKVVYRLRYKLIDGERQATKTFRFLLYP